MIPVLVHAALEYGGVAPALCCGAAACAALAADPGGKQGSALLTEQTWLRLRDATTVRLWV
jgi:hypothetical protein